MQTKGIIIAVLMSVLSLAIGAFVAFGWNGMAFGPMSGVYFTFVVFSVVLGYLLFA